MVTIRNLSLSFEDKKIFENINLHIEKNKITVITGPSGVGKTSLLLCLNQMIKYEANPIIEGEVLYKFNGIETNLNSLKETDLFKLRKEIIYVSQHPDLLPFSLYENLAFFAKAHNILNIKEKIIEVLKKVYLYDEVKDNLYIDALKLSGGQQQRLILARAFLLNPKILLLDEPTASLNEELALKIEKMLQEQNITIVIISHFKSQVKNLADIIYNF
jgi:phosphate transport system ATP-binding protein